MRGAVHARTNELRVKLLGGALQLRLAFLDYARVLGKHCLKLVPGHASRAFGALLLWLAASAESTLTYSKLNFKEDRASARSCCSCTRRLKRTTWFLSSLNHSISAFAIGCDCSWLDFDICVMFLCKFSNLNAMDLFFS